MEGFLMVRRTRLVSFCALVMGLALAFLGCLLLSRDVSDSFLSRRFSMIREGMSQADVEAVLGQPENCGVHEKYGRFKDRCWYHPNRTYSAEWRDSENVICLEFDREGRVVGKDLFDLYPFPIEKSWTGRVKRILKSV